MENIHSSQWTLIYSFSLLLLALLCLPKHRCSDFEFWNFEFCSVITDPHWCVSGLLVTVGKQLHLPEEAALSLRNYELELVISWTNLSECLTVNLSEHVNSQCLQLSRINFYNQQVVWIVTFDQKSQKRTDSILRQWPFTQPSLVLWISWILYNLNNWK